MESEKIVEGLKNNAVFQLSLSSKELFHSNFLCWLAEDKNCSAVFTEVLKLFGFENNVETITEGLLKGEYMALREYKNFDFCICEKVKNFKHDKDDEDADEEYIPGRLLLVLENKFKSIPYKEQLEKYSEKAEELNKDGRKNKAKALWLKKNPEKKSSDLPYWNEKKTDAELGEMENFHTQFVLLSLAKEVCGIDNLSSKSDFSIVVSDSTNQKKEYTWRFVSYEDYAKVLDEEANNSNFTNELIKRYAQFLLSFQELLYTNIELPSSSDVEKKAWGILSSRKDMKEIRMDDIWQKLVANVIGIELRNQLELKGYKIKSIKNINEVLGDERIMPKQKEIILGIGFSRGTALIELKLVLNQNILFGVQIQGKAYKRLLEVVDDNYEWETDLGNFVGMFRYKNNQWNPETNDIFDDELAPQKEHEVKKYNNVPKGFGGYGGKFICQWKNITNTATVDSVIAVVLADIKKAEKIKSEKYASKQ